MTRARAALLVATAVAGLVSSTWRLAGAEAGAPLHGKVIVFVEDAVSFEEVMAVSQFQSVATVGGAALMATNGNYRDNATSVFQALGSGGHPDGPKQLMSHALATRGIAVCVREAAGLSGYRPPAPMSPLRYLGLGVDGEAACREGEGTNPDEVVFLHDHFVSDFAQPKEARNPADLVRLRRQALKTEGKVVEGILGGALSAERLLVLVISPIPSADMGARGDEVSPLLMASGTNLRLFDPVHRPHALRSDTTRQAGLVANVDIAPTILDFFGIPIPSEMDGQPRKQPAEHQRNGEGDAAQGHDPQRAGESRGKPPASHEDQGHDGHRSGAGHKGHLGQLDGETDPALFQVETVQSVWRWIVRDPDRLTVHV